MPSDFEVSTPSSFSASSSSSTSSSPSPAVPFEPLRLPNGSTLKNRVAKAAMEEMLASVSQFNQPNDQIVHLYKTWGDGGAALILSGHVMIDPRALAASGDILLSKDAPQLDEAKFKEWFSAAQSNGAQMWLQLNHPGRQVRKGMKQPTFAPSAVPMELGSKFLSDQFPVPIELTEEKIFEIVERFVWAAKKAEEMGASGVQIHAAHGYLISQFLSPKVNKRTDRWGGAIENRARILLEVVRRVRAGVSPAFGVAVKINSADFQSGGFSEDDSAWVVQQLNTMGLDFVELSGGNYESPAMSVNMSGKRDDRVESTKQREAYFLEFAERVRPLVTIPLMVTGGVSRLSTLNEVAALGNTIVGVGSALGLVPDLVNRWQRGEDPAPTTATPSSLMPKQLARVAKLMVVQYNLGKIGNGEKTSPHVWPSLAVAVRMCREFKQNSKYNSWIKTLGN